MDDLADSGRRSEDRCGRRAESFSTCRPSLKNRLRLMRTDGEDYRWDCTTGERRTMRPRPNRWNRRPPMRRDCACRSRCRQNDLSRRRAVPSRSRRLAAAPGLIYGNRSARRCCSSAAQSGARRAHRARLFPIKLFTKSLGSALSRRATRPPVAQAEPVSACALKLEPVERGDLVGATAAAARPALKNQGQGACFPLPRVSSRATAYSAAAAAAGSAARRRPGVPCGVA